MHADTLKDGLSFLKTQGYDVIQKISQLQKNSPMSDKIQEDFDRILNIELNSGSPNI